MPPRWSTLRLTQKVPVSGPRSILTDPLVGEGAVYASDPFGGDVVCFDRQGFRETWRIPSRQLWPRWSYGRHLLISSLEASVVDATDGRVLWTRSCRFGAVAWCGEIVLQQPEGIEIVEAATGEVRESIPVPGGLSTSARLCGDVLIVKTAFRPDLPVRAFHLRERRVVWERMLVAEAVARSGVEDPDPLLSFAESVNERLVMTCGRLTLACSLVDGRMLWHAPVPVTYHWPNVHAGRVYVLFLDRFIAIDELTGEIVYDVLHPELRGAYRARPGTVYGETIAFANESGHLAVFDLRDGSLVWLHKYKAPLWGTAEADGRLLVSTGDGKLLVFEEKPGKGKAT